jgi:hypothetical protein
MSDDVDPRDPLSIDPTRLVTGQPTRTKTVEEVRADYPHVEQVTVHKPRTLGPSTSLNLFEPRTVGVQVNMIRDQVTYNPPAVKSVFGRGDWPHQNIVFVRYTSMWEIIETKMCSAYYSMGAYLETVKYFGDEEATRQAEARYAAEMKEWNRWYRRLARLPHRLHEWYGNRTWRRYEWHFAPWYQKVWLLLAGRRRGRGGWKL